LEVIIEQLWLVVSIATTDTATDYTINKTPLPLATSGHSVRTMLAKGCPKVQGGRGYHRLACDGCGMQWGGTAEAGILGGI